MELKILASLAKSREAFEQVESFMSSKDLSPLGAEIYKDILVFYEADDGADAVDLKIVKDRVGRRLKGQHLQEKLDDIFSEIDSAKVSPSNVTKELLEQKKSKLGHELASAILAGDEGAVPFLMEEYTNIRDIEELDETTGEVYSGESLSSIISEHFAEGSLIKISPKSLSDRLNGGLRRGHHVVVVALPETGKTLLSIHLTVGVANNGHSVLYLGNEEPIRDIIVRTVSCMSGKPTNEVINDPEGCEEIARSVGYDNITFAGLDPGTLWEVNALVRKHKPDVVIVDQIRNVKARTENRTTQLEAVAQGIRTIARVHNCVAISITQGADSARDRLVLDQGDVDSSNIGIPGACDLMLMMGSNEEYRRMNARMLTLAKNKVSGRHDSWPIQIVPEISRIVDSREEL